MLVSERPLACAFSTTVLKDFYDFAATSPVRRRSATSDAGGQQVPAGLHRHHDRAESIRNTIEEYGVEHSSPSDVIIANDPYRTGTHVNDMLFIRPVFHGGGTLCGFVNLKAHQLDMGGSVAGGFSAHKFSVYENGLVLSPRALMKAGKPVNETLTLIFDNARFGELKRLAMQTIIACLVLGESLLQDSIARYGARAVLGAMRHVCDADAERMATAIAALPDGQWQGRRSGLRCGG